MAVLHTPVRMRTYDMNPRGSATALATMRGDNPFDRRVIAKVRDLRGMDIGDATTDPAPATTNTAADSTTTPVTITQATALTTASAAPSFMDSVVSALTGAGAALLPRLATNLLKPAGDSGPVPGTNPIQVMPMPVKKGLPTWAIPAGVAVAAIGLFMVLRKK